MTDVPFVAASQAALLAGVWWARRPRGARIAAATALALVAAWIRQPGAALLVGLAAAATRAGRRQQAIVPAAGLVSVFVGQAWFAGRFGAALPLTERMSDVIDALRVSPGVYAEGVVVALAFIGLCAAPAALAAGPVNVRRVLVALAALAAASLVWGTPMLRDGTMWGACELGGARSLLSAPPPRCMWAGAARAAALVLASIGLGAAGPPALAVLARALRVIVAGAARDGAGGEAARAVFLTVSFATLFAGMAALWLFADRYWLLFAVAAPALVLQNGVRRPRAGAAALAAYAIIAVSGTRDVFAFYTRVNALADSLAARGIAAEQIDGGYAVNAWRRYLTQPSARGGEGRNANVPWVSAVGIAPWTIANGLEDGWHRDAGSGGVPAPSGLVVERAPRRRR